MQQMLDDRKKVPSLQRMKLLPDIDKHGSVTDVLTPGQELMVQIVKEPISSKGPRLTTEITFTGTFFSPDTIQRQDIGLAENQDS